MERSLTLVLPCLLGVLLVACGDDRRRSSTAVDGHVPDSPDGGATGALDGDIPTDASAVDGGAPVQDGGGVDASTPADAGPTCTDEDDDGFGVGCGLGPDCDDGAPSCTDDCSDLDSSGMPDCSETVGTGVLLYNGAGGGGYDIYEDELEALYDANGYAADQSATVPTDLVDRYGLLLVLSPTAGFPAGIATQARSLLARGGRVVLVTEHGGYADHEGATSFLTALGSSMSSIQSSDSGSNMLTITPVSPFTDGVAVLTLYYSASIDAGGGTPLGVTDAAETAIAHEGVLRGDVIVVADGSFFGYAIDWDDNATFLLNLASGL